MERQFPAEAVIIRYFCDTCEQEVTPTGKFDIEHTPVLVEHTCVCSEPHMLPDQYPKTVFRQKVNVEEVDS